MNALVSIDSAADMIRSGKNLVLAGSEEALAQLPTGNWVAGTIPYFVDPTGGVVASDRVFVTTLPEGAEVVFAHYGDDAVGDVVGRAPQNGFTVAIVPAFSLAHRIFARDAATYPGAFFKPTVGWVAGVLLERLGKQTPKVFEGRTGKKHEEGFVVAHVALPDSLLTSIEIINIFEPDGGDVLTFDATGFDAFTVKVNGTPRGLAGYLTERGNADGKLPLVGDYAGAHINVSVQSLDAATGKVTFYAPVFDNVEYRIARPVADYAGAFRAKLASYPTDGVAFSCNCILNFLYGELEGKPVGNLHGPVTFGEIGYQLLNQTLALVRVS